MPESPASGVRFIHTAMRSEAAAIEQAAHEPVPDLKQVGEWIDHLAHVNEIHTSGEEEFLFPLLDAKVGKMSPVYLLDHEDEKATFAELRSLADALQKGDPADSRLARLRRQTVVLHEHLRSHIHKEETIVVPLLEQHATEAEQAQAVAGVISAIPREDMPALLPWIFRALTPADQAIYATEMLKGMPPPMHAVAGGWVKAGIPTADWTALSKAVPQWAAIG